MTLRTCLTLLGAFGLAATLNAETFSAKSPDGKNEIRLTTGDDLRIEVLRDGKTRIAPTPISLTVEGKGVLGAKPAGATADHAALRTTPPTPAGFPYKKAVLDTDGNLTAVNLKSGYRVDLVARNDGVAYRFATSFDGKIKVLDEQAGLAFASPDQTAYVGYNWGNPQDPLQNSWESIYVKTPVSKIAADKQKLVYLPILLQYEDGGVVCVTESDLHDYSGWNLYRDGKEPNALRAWMGKYPVAKELKSDGRYIRVGAREPWIVETTGTRTFPWRVFVMADQPAKLMEADIVDALATPTKLADVSWIKPGKVAWDWWNNWNVSGVPFRAGCNTKTYEYYIDFAAKNGIEYVIFDEGWSVHLDVTKINPAVDVPALVAYGAKKNVGIILWCAWAQLDGRQEEICARYAKMGVKGFKIDFMDREDAAVVNFHEKTAEVAAKHHLLVDFHGMSKPTGLTRTWPNLVNYEGVHGLEHLKWENGSDFMAHDCQIPFTRMVAGPMDYTPGAMINQTKDQFRACNAQPTSQGTRCHQMALMTLFEAPLQMLCDSPTQYMKAQECTDFMAKVPTIWDDTVGLAGEIGVNAAVARRKGDVWYVAAIGNWTKQTLKLDTSFLGKGTWKADVFADGVNADRDATDYAHTTTTLKAGEPLTITLMPGGGWTARLTK